MQGVLVSHYLIVTHSTMSFIWDSRQALHCAPCWDKQRRPGLAMPCMFSWKTFWWAAAPCFGCPFAPFSHPYQDHAGPWSRSLWELLMSPASLQQAVGPASSPYFWCSACKSSAIKTNWINIYVFRNQAVNYGLGSRWQSLAFTLSIPSCFKVKYIYCG